MTTNGRLLRSLGGELVIVVVGILIALAIDQALQGRSERRLEETYLASLRDDFASTVEWLDTYGAELNSRKERKILELERVLSHAATSPVDTVDVLYSLALLGFHPIFPVPRATFDDLTGTGNLRVVRDADLRRSIGDFYVWVETFSTHERAMVERAGDFKQEVDRHIPANLLASVAALGWDATPDAWAALEKAQFPDSLRNRAALSGVVARLRGNPSVVAALSTRIDDLLSAAATVRDGG